LVNDVSKTVLFQATFFFFGIAPNKSIIDDKAQIAHENLEYTFDVFGPQGFNAMPLKYRTKAVGLVYEISVGGSSTMFILKSNGGVIELQWAAITRSPAMPTMTT
jgi:hypothetical protein